MEIYNTMNMQTSPAVIALVYGEPGVGKTTFAATAPKALLADCEGGAKYFGARGIAINVAPILTWENAETLKNAVLKAQNFDTIIIDPIGELMDKLMDYMIGRRDRKLVQADGSPSMAGWGWLKKTMKAYFRQIKDSGKNVILIGHVEEKTDNERMIKRPKMQTKLIDEIVAMVDIVGYMTTINQNGTTERKILVDPTDDRITAKDRTGALGQWIEPSFPAMLEKIKASMNIVEATPTTPEPAVATPATTPAPTPVTPQPDPVAPTQAPVSTTDVYEKLKAGVALAKTEYQQNQLQTKIEASHKASLLTEEQYDELMSLVIFGADDQGGENA